MFGKIVVHFDQNVEVFLSRAQQSAVFQSLSTTVFKRFDLGHLEVEPEPDGNALIKKHFHSVPLCCQGSGLIV